MTRFLFLLFLLLISPVRADDGWQLRKQDTARDILVYQRNRAVGPFQSVYAVTRLPGSVRQIEAVLTDVNAMPEWMPRVARARLIKRQDPQAWFYIEYHLPYPFTPRDAVILSRRSNDNGIVNIRSQAVTGSVPVRLDHVRLGDLQSTWRLSPLSGGQVKVELWGNGSPGGLIPAVLYNYNLAEDALHTMRQLRRMAQRGKYQDGGAVAPAAPKM